MVRTGGWHGDPARHALAAKGIKTRSVRPPVRWSQKVDVKEGALAGWSKDMPQKERLEILHTLVRKDGYATVIQRLNFLINIGQDPETDRAAKADMKELQEYYRPEHGGVSLAEREHAARRQKVWGGNR